MAFIRITIFAIIVAVLAPSLVVADEFEPSPHVLDGDGNYVFTYTGEDEAGNPVSRTLVVVPATKTSPRVQAEFHWPPSRSIEYRYTIGNRSTARQSIRVIRIRSVITDADLYDILGRDIREPGWSKGLNITREQRSEIIKRLDASVTSPDTWRVMAMPDYGGTGIDVGWSPNRSKGTTGILPGGSAAGFGMRSPDLPGIGKLYVIGDAPTLRIPSDVDDRLAYTLEEFFAPGKNSLIVYGAIPRITNPTPFNAAIVISGLKDHVDELVVEGMLSQEFASELSNGLEQAHAATNEPKRARDVIKNIRQFVHSSHPGIGGGKADKNLIVQVLDFDLRYLEQELQRASVPRSTK